MASSRNGHRICSSPFFLILCLFYIFTSALAASTVLGLDLGTEYIKATLVKPGMQNVLVETKDTRRKEAATIAFKPAQKPKAGEYPERAYGSDAVALSARFPGDVYPNLKTLLGLPADNSVVKDYASRHPALKLVADKIRGTAAFQSGAFADGEEPWTVEELLAMQLQSIQKNAEALAGKGSIVKDLVITVPPFYTAEEKRAVVLAADLAGLRVLELVSDGLAVGLNYAMTRKFASINEEGVKPEYHMVFDMGAGSTKASVIKFQGRTVKDIGKFNKTIQEVQVLGSGWDRTLGGDALNAVIVDDMVNKFVETPAAKKVSATVEGVKAHGRAMSKLWKEAERLRQVLSANTNTQGSFEGLYEDVDFRYKISRAEFEELSASHAARIGVAIQKALEAAELTINDLDSVILHGGAIRTPFILKELETIVGNAEKLRSNVNADEAAVFGAGFRGATLSPSFRVKEIRASDSVSYAAGIKWININEKPQHQRLWQPTSFIGAEKQYTFKNQKDFDINFYQHVPSSENVSPGSAEKELITVTTQNLTESVAVLKDKFGCTDGDINLKLSSRISASDGEVNIMKLVLDCEVEDIEKAGMVDSMKNMFGFGKKDQAPLEEVEPLDSTSSTESSSSSSSSTSSSTKTKTKSAKDSKKTKESTKPTKHFEVIPIKYTVVRKGRPQLPAEELSRMKDRIAAFAGSDRTRKLREEALNQLEGFTYRVRDYLDDSKFIEASTPEERASLESKGKEASEWMYTPEGRDATRDELKAKLQAMEDIVGPIQNRKDEAVALPAKLQSLEVALNETKQTIVGITEQIENDTKIHESWSSSKSAAATATPSPSPADEFSDLEDDSPETSAPVEEQAPDPPTYTTADLVKPQELFDSITAWLGEMLPQQKALKPTDDPILLVRDISVKIDQLNQVKVDLIMKSMKRPYKSTRPPTKSKSAKKSSKTTTSTTSSKTASAEKADATFNIEDLLKDGPQKYEPNSGPPSEDDILAFIEKQKIINQMAEEKMAKEQPADKQDDDEGIVDVDAEDGEEQGVDDGHDEL